MIEYLGNVLLILIVTKAMSHVEGSVGYMERLGRVAEILPSGSRMSILTPVRPAKAGMFSGS